MSICATFVCVNRVCLVIGLLEADGDEAIKRDSMTSVEKPGFVQLKCTCLCMPY